MPTARTTTVWTRHNESDRDEPADVRKALVSHYGSAGRFLEWDFSQLEVIALAIITGCKQLQEDIKNGLDIHGYFAEKLFGSGWGTKERTYCKQISFQLQYGATAKGMAKKINGLDVGTAENYIREYYSRYPEVQVWQQRMLKSASRDSRHPLISWKTLEPVRQRTTTGVPAIYTQSQCPLTGRKYSYIWDDPPWDAGNLRPRPTQVKNYNIQGFATGDLTPVMVGAIMRELFRRIPDHDVLHAPDVWDAPYRLVLTTHDSLTIDVHREVINEVIDVVDSVMKNAKQIMAETFGNHLLEAIGDLPVSVELEISADNTLFS